MKRLQKYLELLHELKIFIYLKPMLRALRRSLLVFLYAPHTEIDLTDPTALFPDVLKTIKGSSMQLVAEIFFDR